VKIMVNAASERQDEGSSAQRSLEPREVWTLLERGDARLLDLRTGVERRRYGYPPGAIQVSLASHILKPEGRGAIYLCQHAIRSKATLRNGAAEVAGGFVAWERAGLPVEQDN
jgi:rhodanese-related sulfurtransferase